MYASMLPSLLNMKTENLTNSGYDDDLLFEENLVLQMMGELFTKVFRIIGLCTHLWIYDIAYQLYYILAFILDLYLLELVNRGQYNLVLLIDACTERNS